MSERHPGLDVVVVNWNAGNLLRQCVCSIAAAKVADLEIGCVVVVDNASVDGSAERLECEALDLRLIRNEFNRGFAAACNQGAGVCRSDYILFLNPDTRLYGDSLIRPLRFMDEPANRRVGICGVQLVDEYGRVARTCSRFPSLASYVWEMTGLDRLLPTRIQGHFMREWDHGESRDVDQVMGAFFLVRRDLFVRLSGFDERFFVYFEEVDFSLRARACGMRSHYLAQTQVYHKGCGTTEQIRAKRLFYSLRSRLLYGYKHFDRLRAHLLLLVTLVPEAVSRLLLAGCRRSGAQMWETVHGYALLWRELPRLVSGSRRSTSASQ